MTTKSLLVFSIWNWLRISSKFQKSFAEDMHIFSNRNHQLVQWMLEISIYVGSQAKAYELNLTISQQKTTQQCSSCILAPGENILHFHVHCRFLCAKNTIRCCLVSFYHTCVWRPSPFCFLFRKLNVFPGSSRAVSSLRFLAHFEHQFQMMFAHVFCCFS